MNKNLKKVISAVGALSMVASSAAAFATTFPDVEETASYSQAVKELSSLDIISGYDDGTFRPDELVTRAQISKMIVDALNERSQAEASKSATKFSDVATGDNGHWAAGYINQGVADGFISGYSDTEFGPDDNVTYAQAQSMLVRAIGYDTYATAQGGWPSGYKLYAGSLGITDGVEDVSSDDQQLTRAQVAQMLDNAMDVPVCIIKSYETLINGVQSPVLEVKDGEDKDYQTLFTKKHDTYRVYGRITATSKSAGLDKDKITFSVEKADNFDDVTIKSGDETEEDMYFASDIDVDSALNVYSQALIQKDSDDDFTLLTISAATSSSTVSLASEDFDKTSTSGDKQYYQFYAAGTTKNSTKYQIADDATFYVNGAESDYDFDEIAEMIDNDTAIAVTLIKKSDTGKTTSSEKGYNVVMITKYATAVVDEVTDKTDEVRITFDETSYDSDVNDDFNGKSSWTVEKDDDDVDYKFTLDGTEISAEDLQENDVLSIAYDRSGEFVDSNFYTVIVSRDTVTGKCSSVKTGTDQFNDEYKVDGTTYKFATAAGQGALDAGDSYVLYLDHFGRIAAYDDEETSKNYAVLKNFYLKADGVNYVATIITKDGEEVDYTVDSNSETSLKTLWDDDKYDNEDVSGSQVTVDGKSYYVIDYKITSSSKLKLNDVLAWTRGGEDQEYRASSTKFDNVKLSETSTILDIEDIDEVKTVSISSLTDGVEYDVYGFDVKDGISRYVLITQGASSYTADTQLAVFMGREVVDDDETQYNLVLNGEEVSYILKDTLTDIADNGTIDEGDPVVVATDASGKISKISPVFKDADMLSSADADTFTQDTIDALLGEAVEPSTFVVDDLLDVDDDVTYAFGVAVKRSGSDLTIGAVYTTENADGDTVYATTETGSGDKKAYIGTIGSDTKIYSYDFDITNKNLSKVVTDNSVEVSSIANSDYIVKGGDEIDLTGPIEDNEVVFVLARMDNDDIMELYQFLPAED